MPKVILSSNAGLVSLVDGVGEAIKKLVAEAASTSEAPLTPDDVDFIPVTNSIWALAPDIGIEIEAIGYPTRKAKLSQEEVVLKLKHDILAIPGFPKVDPKKPLIWIKFWDPAGIHV